MRNEMKSIERIAENVEEGDLVLLSLGELEVPNGPREGFINYPGFYCGRSKATSHDNGSLFRRSSKDKDSIVVYDPLMLFSAICPFGSNPELITRGSSHPLNTDVNLELNPPDFSFRYVDEMGLVTYPFPSSYAMIRSIAQFYERLRRREE